MSPMPERGNHNSFVHLDNVQMYVVLMRVEVKAKFNKISCAKQQALRIITQDLTSTPQLRERHCSICKELTANLRIKANSDKIVSTRISLLY